MELLRKKDVVDRVGAPKSTISDWISEYSMFLPMVQQGNKTYYKPETVEVLRAIKEMRDRDISKTQIAEKLASLFPINAEETASTLERSAEKGDAMIAVMSTIGKVVEQLGRNDARLREMAELMEKLKEEAAASREKTEELEEKVKQLEEEKAKGFWSRILGL